MRNYKSSLSSKAVEIRQEDGNSPQSCDPSSLFDRRDTISKANSHGSSFDHDCFSPAVIGKEDRGGHVSPLVLRIVPPKTKLSPLPPQ